MPTTTDTLATGYVELQVRDQGLKDSLAGLFSSIERQGTGFEKSIARHVTGSLVKLEFQAKRVKKILADSYRESKKQEYRRQYGAVGGTMRYLRDEYGEKTSDRFNTIARRSGLLAGGLIAGAAAASGNSVSDTLTGSFKLLANVISRPLIPMILSFADALQRAANWFGTFQKEHPGLASAAGYGTLALGGLAALGAARGAFRLVGRGYSMVRGAVGGGMSLARGLFAGGAGAAAGTVAAEAGAVGTTAAATGAATTAGATAGAAAAGTVARFGLLQGLKMLGRFIPWVGAGILAYEGFSLIKSLFSGGGSQANVIGGSNEPNRMPLLAGPPVAHNIYDPTALRDAALMATIGSDPLQERNFREELESYRVMRESAEKMAGAADKLNDAAERMTGGVPLPPGS